MKSSWLGVFFITMFVLISAAREVYIGRLIQNLAPGVLAFFALSVTTLFFLVLKRGLRGT